MAQIRFSRRKSARNHPDLLALVAAGRYDEGMDTNTITEQNGKISAGSMQLLTYKQAAERLGVSVRQVRRLARANRLTAIRYSRKVVRIVWSKEGVLNSPAGPKAVTLPHSQPKSRAAKRKPQPAATQFTLFQDADTLTREEILCKATPSEN